MTTSELQNKIDNFSELIEDFGSENFNSKEIWALKNDIFESFKDTDFDDRNQRQDYWNKFQSLGSILKQKQNSVSKQNEEFAEEAESRIDKINEALGGDIFVKRFKKEDFSEIKDLINETFEFIKQNRWPNKDRRLKAWDLFFSYKEKFKKEQDEFYSEIREKISKRKEKSEELTETIINTIKACDPDTDINDLIELSAKALSFLTPLGPVAAGFGYLFKALEIGLGLDQQKQKSPLRMKSEALRDIRKFINENRDDLTKEDKQKIYSELDEVQEALDQAWTEHKEQIQQKKEEREEKQARWEKNQREFLSKLEDRLEKQIAFKEKLENIYEKQQAFLEKLEKRLDNQEDFLKNLNDQLEELEEKYETAWNDNFKEKVSDWIDSKKDKISEVESDISDIETKISEVKDGLENLPSKIKDVEQSIDDIEEKILEVKSKL